MTIIAATQRAQLAMSRFEAHVSAFKVAAKRGDRPECERCRLEAWQCLDEYFDAMAVLVGLG